MRSRSSDLHAAGTRCLPSPLSSPRASSSMKLSSHARRDSAEGRLGKERVFLSTHSEEEGLLLIATGLGRKKEKERIYPTQICTTSRTDAEKMCQVQAHFNICSSANLIPVTLKESSFGRLCAPESRMRSRGQGNTAILTMEN